LIRLKNIVLIGMPGTGKSTVGVILAKRLGYDFIDTDLLIIKKAGKTLPEILEDKGIGGFLEIENLVGAGLRCERSVIATGGSMALCKEAMENLKSRGITVWLDTELEALKRRLMSFSNRGIAAEPGQTVADIYEARRPFYEKYADIRIKCAGDTESVVGQVINALAESGAIAAPAPAT